MPCPTKGFRMLYERLKVTEEMENNLTEEWIDVAKHLILAPYALNFIVVKKRASKNKCCKFCKERKMG
jgi:hypothetical protein